MSAQLSAFGLHPKIPAWTELKTESKNRVNPVGNLCFTNSFECLWFHLTALEHLALDIERGLEESIQKTTVHNFAASHLYTTLADPGGGVPEGPGPHPPQIVF